jgi:cation diffusion facilitator CzcD-associated flavoprotein CzcO
MTRICVVGAGPAGLVSTKTLAEAGLEVDCLELSPCVGGHWVFDNPNGRSAVYQSIHTNTTLAMSRLSDYAMPSDWPTFPSHEQVREWWEGYVDHFGFRDRIQHETEVVAARPLEPTGWRVELRGADGTTREERYDALLACTGSYWDPRMPDLPGIFEGEVLHTLHYRDPERPIAMQGRRVLVVGIGNTGCEIACEIAKAGAESVHLSARSGNWIMPKYRNGRPLAENAPLSHPCDPVPLGLRLLPARLRELAFEWMSVVMFRRMFAARMERLASLGLPPPPRSPLAKRPTIADGLLDALESGAIRARPAIERLEGRSVRYADGERAPIDVIVYATGFHLRYPYLPSDLVDTRNDDLRLFMGTMHPERRDLFVIGVSRPTGAFWPIAEVHARFAAALLAGRYQPPRARRVRARARPILGGHSFNPALFGLAVREELRRGERRAGTATSAGAASRGPGLSGAASLE